MRSSITAPVSLCIPGCARGAEELELLVSRPASETIGGRASLATPDGSGRRPAAHPRRSVLRSLTRSARSVGARAGPAGRSRGELEVSDRQDLSELWSTSSALAASPACCAWFRAFYRDTVSPR
jgi:hypothetical protein